MRLFILYDGIDNVTLQFWKFSDFSSRHTVGIAGDDIRYHILALHISYCNFLYGRSHQSSTILTLFIQNLIQTRQIWGIWKLWPACSPKRPIWVKIGDVLSRVTLKFDGWPWKTIGHLFFAVSSFVQHFIAIFEFKLELQSGNAQFESNSTISRAMWPWNLMDDLEKQ